MTTAKQMARDALKESNRKWKQLADSGDAGNWSAEEQAHYQASEKAIAALEAELAQVVEPVAYRFTQNRGYGVTDFTYHDNSERNNWKIAYKDNCLEITPLYTAPPEPVNAWMPIETAPKDAEVLVWRDDSGAFIAKLTTPDAVFTDYEMEQNNMEFPDDFEEWWSDAYGWQEGDQKPTQWVPLPKPPGATT